MRLTQIKLSGFKSFVDTTVIPTPSQLVGVVGPNGCGKSNIIDAVRWVLGESRASELRGGSMQDVIFNGSAQRKPAARASVELSFDNSEGRVVGQWGAYTEISVRRELTRDGQSGYFINGQQVRRRDINDIFLGTGLGARGYAIIGQGMINRLIEAKPEELRVYLEEAAGVSRYKERRKETESRLRDTRENLTRLDDIIQELEQQLARLSAQAEVAQHYKQLQTEGETKQHVLWWLRENNARADQKQHALAIEQAQTAVEAAVADIRSTETRLEQLRQQQFEANNTLQQAQAQLYQSTNTVSRIEAEIHHAATAQKRVEQRQEQLTAQKKEWQQLHADSASELQQKQDELVEAEQNLEDSLAQVEELAMRLEPNEQHYGELRSQLEHANQGLQQLRQQSALAQQQMLNLKQQQAQATQRQQRFLGDLQQLKQQESVDLVYLEQRWLQAQDEQKQQQEWVAKLEQQLSERQEKQAYSQSHLNEQQQLLTQIQAQLEALASLQAQLQSQGQLQQWLEEAQLSDAPRLWQQIQVEAGWEQAIEAVLGQRLQALTMDQCHRLLQQPRPPARVWALSPSQNQPRVIATDLALQRLSTKVKVLDQQWQDTIEQLLAGYLAVDSLEQAVALQPQLAENCTLVVAEGHLVASNSVLLYAPDSEQAGMLARQHTITQQQHALKAQQLHWDVAQEAATKAIQDVDQSRADLSKATVALHERTQQTHQFQLAYQQAKQQDMQWLQRQQQIEQELLEVDEQLLQYAEQIEQILLTDEEQQILTEEHLEQQSELQEQAQQLDNQLRLLRDQLRDAEQRSQRITYTKSLTQARVDELLRSQTQALDLMQRAQIELVGLVDEYEQVDQEELHIALQESLEQRVLQEDAVHEAQRVVTAIVDELQTSEKNKNQAGDGVEPLRQRVTELQLAEQAARMTVEQYAEQLDQHQVDRQGIAAFVAEQAESWRKLGWLQTELQRINKAIESLGAVNLAALEELQTAQEREFYLQSQYSDLSQAIETLEDAIRKIDRETRALLQTTFNQVNQHFGELFPVLFGGGEAKLLMTGDEVLDGGVQVMAQPPGKRNSTIQLLSGGEKALTATALVFAFFKLNPAPFCLLDEVDAPLDDANTERYANLVDSMSEQTQFLFISHNKIAMQMAKQLVGVTMQEQGVSRIVAVDMASAIDMTN